MEATQKDKDAAPPWYAAYPEASAAETLDRETFLKMVKSGKQAGKDFVLVDLRRNDHEGGTIAGSINLPAQTLYPTIPNLYVLFKEANVPLVIWYCGSSTGRGLRAAGWFADHIREQKDTTMRSVALEGGIKGWVKAGKDYTDTMLEFDATKWQ